MAESKVYFTKEISKESLLRIYEAIGVEVKGKTCVKLSTGEAGGHNFLDPVMIEPLVSLLNGTIVECCTAYAGKRIDPKDHWQVIRDHGFMDIAPCDIMDEKGDFPIPVNNGFHLKENYIGESFKKYDSMLVLSHFKGHAMGGFGGALKNMSIGIASTKGKTHIHTAGVTQDYHIIWQNKAEQDVFLECMADACKSVVDYMGCENIVYINVANRLSVDCDCDSNPAEPEMGDIGVFASTDPVALDRACYDAVKNSPDEGKAAMIERMDSRHGIHTVEAAEKLGLGSQRYVIIEI